MSSVVKAALPASRGEGVDEGSRRHSTRAPLSREAGTDQSTPDTCAYTDQRGTRTVNSHDPWFYFCHDERWRIVATVMKSDSDPKEVFVYHSAGLDGRGGSSYIDSVILRDRDANTAWTAPADGTLEERRYYCQNWRGDVSVILTDTGKIVEWVKYSAYGIAYGLPAGDNDSDGDWDDTDKSNMTGAYDVRKDANLDGVIDSNDEPHASSITGGFQTLGWNTLTSSAVNNRIGYAGYKFAPELAGNKWHVRNRMLDSFNGIWNRFDPLGYVDGMNLYQYAASSPVVFVDPLGMMSHLAAELVYAESQPRRRPDPTVTIEPSSPLNKATPYAARRRGLRIWPSERRSGRWRVRGQLPRSRAGR